MHWQVDEDDIDQYVIPENVVDLQFGIDCKLLPVDHAYALSTAIQQKLPWFAEDETAALHLIHGADSGNGWERPEAAGDVIYLSRRTKLILRVPAGRVDDAVALCGQELDVAGNLLIVGSASKRQLSITTSLYSRHVVVEPGEDEDAFLQRIVNEMGSMNLRFTKVLCGKEHSLAIPEGVVITRSLLVADLNFDDAITLQERGVGAKAHKKLGCGLFIAHKTV
jgi:CRISPR-associated protein Cas6